MFRFVTGKAARVAHASAASSMISLQRDINTLAKGKPQAAGASTIDDLIGKLADRAGIPSGGTATTTKKKQTGAAVVTSSTTAPISQRKQPLAVSKKSAPPQAAKSVVRKSLLLSPVGTQEILDKIFGAKLANAMEPKTAMGPPPSPSTATKTAKAAVKSLPKHAARDDKSIVDQLLAQACISAPTDATKAKTTKPAAAKAPAAVSKAKTPAVVKFEPSTVTAQSPAAGTTPSVASNIVASNQRARVLVLVPGFLVLELEDALPAGYTTPFGRVVVASLDTCSSDRAQRLAAGDKARCDLIVNPIHKHFGQSPHLLAINVRV
jgi:hypothetical protein